MTKYLDALGREHFMSLLTFLKIEGVTEMYEAVHQGEIIGLVWRNKEIWHASVNSMANPTITENSKENAASKLLEEYK